MDAEAARVLDLMRKLRSLHASGSREDAAVLYRYLAPAWAHMEHANPWKDDDGATAEAVEILCWMGKHPELPPFRNGWPDWLAQWFVVTHGPTALLKPLRLKHE